MISAVDLLKGIGKFSGMNVVDVQGATGYIDTNFDGKAQACINELKNGQDFVYIHVEAPDECGHRNEMENKISAIELIDKKVLGPVLDALEQYDDYKIMILPDHPTPICKRTHTMDAVPFFIYSSEADKVGCDTFDEFTTEKMNYYVENGYTLMDILIQK